MKRVDRFVSRQRATISSALMAMALALAGVAWACSPQPSLRNGSNKAGAAQTSGPAGTQITVTGEGFMPGPVRIHWNSRGGELLGEGQGPSFAVSVTIPAAQPGVHYIVAYPLAGPGGSFAFEVIPASSSATGAEATPATTSATASAPAGTKEAGSGTGAGSGSSGDSSPAGTNPGSQTPAGGPAATASSQQPSGAGPEAPAGTTAPGASANPRLPDPAGETAAATSQLRSRARRPGSEAAAPASREAASAPGRQATTAVEPPVQPAAPPAVPASATVAGDTWSGFANGTWSFSALGENAAGARQSSAPALGVALLVLGLAALTTGFSAAAIGRRRATSR